MIKILPISGNNEQYSIIQRLKVLFQKKPELKKSAKKLKFLDQKKDWACATFATAWCLQYNSWIEFYNEELTEWAKKKNWNIFGPTTRVAEVFCRELGREAIQLNILSKETECILESGLAVVISTDFPVWFFTEGVNYGRIYGKWGGKVMRHAMYLIKINNEYKIVNSWGAMVALGKYNEYKIDLHVLVSLNYINKICILCI